MDERGFSVRATNSSVSLSESLRNGPRPLSGFFDAFNMSRSPNDRRHDGKKCRRQSPLD